MVASVDAPSSTTNLVRGGKVHEDIIKQQNEATKVFRLLRGHLNESSKPKPKKLIAFVTRLMESPDIYEGAKVGILSDILQAKDPVAFLIKRMQEGADTSKIMKQLASDGFHGMFVINSTCHPVKLKTLDKWLSEGVRWNEAQEADIQHELVDKWLEDNPNKTFFGDVILFTEFGFSGVPRRINKERKG